MLSKMKKLEGKLNKINQVLWLLVQIFVMIPLAGLVLSLVYMYFTGSLTVVVE